MAKKNLLVNHRYPLPDMCKYLWAPNNNIACFELPSLLVVAFDKQQVEYHRQVEEDNGGDDHIVATPLILPVQYMASRDGEREEYGQTDYNVLHVEKKDQL